MAKKMAAARNGLSCTEASSALLCDLTNSRVRYCFRSKTKNAAMAATIATRTTIFPLLMAPPTGSDAARPGSVGAAMRSLHHRGGSRRGGRQLVARAFGDAAEIRGVRARPLGPGREESAAPQRLVVLQRQRFHVDAADLHAV